MKKNNGLKELDDQQLIDADYSNKTEKGLRLVELEVKLRTLETLNLILEEMHEDRLLMNEKDKDTI